MILKFSENMKLVIICLLYQNFYYVIGLDVRGPELLTIGAKFEPKI